MSDFVLSELLQETLEGICECLERCDLCVPDCVYISHCPPPVDCCDILAVYPGLNPLQTAASGQPNGCVVTNNVTVSAEYWFCYPIPTFVSGIGGDIDAPILGNYDEMSIATMAGADFAEAIYLGGIESLASDCQSIAASSRCLPPRGGCAGWQFNWTLLGEVI